MRGQSDMNLVKELAQGSEAAFCRLYERYSSLVMRVALQVTKDWSEAEDVCQDVFMEVLHKAEQYDAERGSIESWLAIRTQSRARDRLRKRRRLVLAGDWEEQASTDLLRTTENVELRVLQRLEAERIKRELEQIPDMQRAAIYGKYIASLSHQELADSLQRPVGTVKSLIRYGVRNVRKRLEGSAVSMMRRSV